MSKQRGLRFWTRFMFNVPRWIGWHDIKRNAVYIGNTYSSLYTQETVSTLKETFEESIKRQHLTEDDIIRIQAQYFKRSLVYLCLWIAGVVYGFYFLYKLNVGSFIIMLSLSSIFFVFWFREYFWYQQIKVRRLGLTLKEWMKLCLHIG